MDAWNEGDGNLPAEMELQDVLDISRFELINPYTGEKMKYVPFGGEPSPGDLTGFLADMMCVYYDPEGPARLSVCPKGGWYTFVYGPKNDPGKDINWDGVGDHIACALHSQLIWTVAGCEAIQKPLDLIFDDLGIEHGPAPDTPGQCAWGKPCAETDYYPCPICGSRETGVNRR
jgi:hypothetical protein